MQKRWGSRILTFALLFGCIGASRGATTNAISAGEIVGGRIIAPSQINYYAFSATSNDVIYLAVVRTNGPGNYPAFDLYDPNGMATPAPHNSEFAELANHRLTKTGSYTIAIYDDGLDESFDYLVSLTVIGANNLREAGDGAEAIVPGQITGGHMSPADFDTFTFNASSNDVIYLAVVRTNGPGNHPAFYLYDPDGTATPADYNSEFAEFANHRLAKSGTYTIAIFDNGLVESFDYLVSLTAIGANNLREAGDGAEPIVPGQITGGHMSPADFDTFTFNATSKDVIYLAVVRTNGPGNYPAFYLYDPDGMATPAPYNAEYAELANLRLAKSGTYTIAVFDNGLVESFDYLVSLTVIGANNLREAGDGAEPIVPGQITGGHMSPADFDTFTFNASSNDVIYLAVVRTNGPGNHPAFHLYDPDGTATPSDYNAEFAELANLRLAKSGTHTVMVLDNGLDESFDYTVCVIKVPGPNSPDPGEGSEILSVGETRAGQITPGDLDAFSFQGIAGDTVTLDARITSGSGQGIFVQLFGPDATVLTSASGGISARIDVPCVTQTGTYIVFLIDNGLNEEFGYRLSLRQSPVVPPSSGNTQYLAIFRCTNHVILRWETNSVGFVLESTPALPAVSWSPVNLPAQIIARHFYVDQGMVTNGNAFYRLRCTGCQ